MYEHDLKYCPRCNDEYRADIEKCGVCQGPLYTGKEMEERELAGKSGKSNRTAEISGDDELVAIRRGPLGDMKVYEKLLLNENIGSILAGDENSCRGGCCGGNFDLLVKSEDAGDAIRLIDEEIRRTSVGGEGDQHADAVFNSEVGESTCPACGHVFKTASECPDCGLNFQIFLS